MGHELKEGVKLKSVTGPQDPESGWINLQVGDKPYQCKEIVVVMQPGQMGMVPWVKVTQNRGLTELINLALMESVILLNEGAE